MRIICVNTGTKFENWYVDNLKHMIDTYSNLQYDSFEVVNNLKFGGVYDKLQMFKLFRDGQNLYFDLDVIITGDCNKFIKKELTVCKAWWRKPYHTPINSSIISWFGDNSNIYDLFVSDLAKKKRIYHKGIDSYLFNMFNPECFIEGFCSFQTVSKYDPKYQVYLFNQRHTQMRWKSWCQKFLLNRVVFESY